MNRQHLGDALGVVARRLDPQRQRLQATDEQRRVLRRHAAAELLAARGADGRHVPLHAAQAIAAQTGLRVLPCPITLPRYAVELGWRTDALRDSALTEVRRILGELLAAFAWH